MIVFSHANGFAAATYRRLFEGWRAAGHEVAAVERYGHETDHPIGRDWAGMTRQLLALIDGLPDPRVWLVGHSMGGYLSLIAAGQRSDRVSGLVLLDAPIVGGWRSGVIALLKATRVIPRVPPASIAAGRRQHWASAEAAHRYFSAKRMFSAWDPAVLRDYIESGTEADPADAAGARRRLKFRREVEAAIYATVPHCLPAYLRRHPLGGPVAFIGGRRSDVIRQAGLAATRRITHGRISWLDGSHLFPFEQPDDTAREVLAWMARLESV